MRQVGISHFLEAFSNPFGCFRELEGLRTDSDLWGDPFYVAGSGAVIFRIIWQGGTYAAKCYLRAGDDSRAAHRRAIDRFTAEPGPYLIPTRYLDDEVWLFDDHGGGAWHPLVLAEWVKGCSLGQRLRELCRTDNREALAALAAEFDGMALWLLDRPFAHGDLKPDNLLVVPGSGLKMIDYDACYLPQWAGEHSPELGTQGFQHPRRERRMYDPHIDDYAIALISTALHALADFPGWFDDPGGDDRLLFHPAEAVAGTSAPLARLRDHWIDTGRTALYRLAGLLASPAPALAGLAEVLAEVARPPSGATVPSGADDWESVRTDGLYGYRNARTGETIDAVYDDAGAFGGGLAPVRIGRRWLYIDHRGSKVLDASAYDAVEPFCEGLAVVRKGARFGYIDREGTPVIPPRWEEARRFSGGLACVREAGRYGFIDRTGRTVVAPRFEAAFDFREGLAVVGEGGLHGYIDARGRVLIAPTYRFASGFRGCEATAELAGGEPVRLFKQGDKIVIHNP